jgi:precorrin-6A/cobalt-precorrin-6A reductase
MASLHVFGGTSDAVKLCTLLEQQALDYSVSVASDVGRAVASELQGEILVGRMDAAAMTNWLAANSVSCVIDAAHPYAMVLRSNIQQACQTLAITLIRYERPSASGAMSHPLLHSVRSFEDACQLAAQFGKRLLLTTGSKDLARFQQCLPDKHLIARVLPTAEVIAQCESLGLGVDQIIAMKGPFSADLNRALYQFCQPDVVITKESGQEGGFQEKIAPCIDAGIACIVIERPKNDAAMYGSVCHSFDEILTLLTRFQTREPA